MSKSEHTSDAEVDQLGPGPVQIVPPIGSNGGPNYPKVDTQGVDLGEDLAEAEDLRDQLSDEDLAQDLREVVFEDELKGLQGVDLNEDLFEGEENGN